MGATTSALYTDGILMPHKITEHDPNRDYAVATNLEFSATLTANVEEVPVKVELPAEEDVPKIIKVTAFYEDPFNQIKYEYNLGDQTINMIGPFGTRNYSINSQSNEEKEVYYTILKIMVGLLDATFVQAGINYDADANDLSINKDKYLDAVKVSSDYNITAIADDVMILITISKGTESVTGTYNFITETLSLSEDMAFASRYELDLINDTLAVIDEPYPVAAAAEIGATGVSDSFKRGATRILSFLLDRTWSGKVVKKQWNSIQGAANLLKHPLQRPVDPDISDIEWVDRNTGLIRIKGTANWEDSADMKVYINNAALVDSINWMRNEWEVTNYSNSLNSGENKVSVKIEKSDGREVESGDATVYLGQNDEPDLILVSPRDREIFENDGIGFPFVETNFQIKGKTTYGTNIKIIVNNEEQSVVVDANGRFEEDKSVVLAEGMNEVFISVSGSGGYLLSKAILGAHKFVVDNKPRAFVLRKGDFLFNGSSTSTEGFAPLPLDPDHAGIYTGDGMVVEAGKDTENWPYFLLRVFRRSLSKWNNDGFYYATQVPKLISEENRIRVADKIVGKIGRDYEWPIKICEQYGLPFTLSGKYTPDNDKFYCSELAFWGWTEVSNQDGFNFGINKEDLFFPMRYIGDDNHNSILPAYLCEKSMEVKRVAK